MAHTHRVPLSALDADGRAVVTLDGREVALFLVGNDVHAFANACPHSGNPLVHGEVRAGTLTCAYHLWRFDLQTGACLEGDAPAEPFTTELEPEHVLITL